MAAGFLVMLLCFLFVRHNGVEGRTGLWQEEDLEFEKRLRLLNKPAVKTFVDEFGITYDCVDFYKQPAFDHHLLKNHTYSHDMKPEFGNKKERAITPRANKTISIGLKERRCPLGTVPIKRTTKEDLMREKLALQGIESGESRVAVAQTRKDATGAQARITLYNPIPGNNQYSSARIHLQNGPEYIQYGWRVDPNLYGDNLTHVFTLINTNTTKCFDLQCGFVVTRRDLSPGYVVSQDRISIRNEWITYIKVTVKRANDGNWWLLLALSGVDTEVGFWPGKLFDYLSNSASYVSWGGEVWSPPSLPLPPMGNGFIPQMGTIKSFAHMKGITAFDLLGNEIDPETEQYTDDQHGNYGVMDYPNPGGQLGHLVLFGGNSG